MRLICPNCDAQYEVDDSAIPETGRDVQCSNCGNAWFQERERRPEDATADLYREPDEPTASPAPEAVAQREDDDMDEPPPTTQAPPIQRSLDASVLSVLREEAEREVAARRAEAAGVEVQGDLGLPPPVKASVAAVAEPNPGDQDVQKVNRRIAAMKGEKVPPEKPAARRDLLPDIEEINSSLRPNDAARMDNVDNLPDLTKGSSGFKSGLALMLLLAIVMAAVYVMAPQISQQIPAASDAMASYVAAVDEGRLWLDGMIRKATQLLNGITNPPA
jgi:predicted Zn finger-like uncharacterized protein